MRVLNLGAGVQSTTVYLMSITGEVSFDCAIFADTQEEPDKVYQHLQWLKSLNGPPIHIVTAGKLGDDITVNVSNKSRFASIPAFLKSDDGSTRGIGRRQCTSEYKIRPIESFIKLNLLRVPKGKRVPKGIVVEQIYGISLDEARRARRIQERLARKRWLRPQFPLLERLMTRQDCITWLARFGVPHEVPRSSCVFCPYHSDSEWLWLKRNSPSGWQRAVEIDRLLREEGTFCNVGLRKKMYLHSSCVPLAEVVFKEGNKMEQQLSISFALECAGACGV